MFNQLLMKFLLCFLLLFSTLSAFDLKYGITAKRAGPTPSLCVQIFSERCSGSFYFLHMLWENFHFGHRHCPYGHKHFPPWFDLPLEEYPNIHKHFYTFENSETTLFVVIFRNPYDWVRSLFLAPQYVSWAAGWLVDIPFRNFIRTKWALDDGEDGVLLQRSLNPLVDLNPLTKERFDNVLKLRSAKIRNMLKIKEKVNNFYAINYEVLRAHPAQVMDEIEQIFGLSRNLPFRDIVHYKGDESQGRYEKKKYPPINQEDLIHINLQLDWQLEAEIHYDMCPVTEFLP